MSKFGDLINSPVPVLIDFYADWSEQSEQMHAVMKDVAAAMGDKAKVIKIDIDKNPQLADALRIKTVPTFIIHKDNKMVWRQSGEIDANTLISTLKEQF